MGCSSPSEETPNFPGEEEYNKPKGDPKKDFFYCFDDKEIELIENKCNQSCEDDYTYLYNKYKFDFLKEKNDTIFMKIYVVLYVKEDFIGECNESSALTVFYFDKYENLSFKVNKKEKSSKFYRNEEVDMPYYENIFKIEESDKKEQFKEILILEHTFKIKYKRILNTKIINFTSYLGDNTTAIFYYDKNKLKIETKSIYDDDKNLNITTDINELKIFNEEGYSVHLKYNQKIKFNKKEETLLKKIFSSDEIKQIYSSLEKIDLNDDINFVYEKVKHNIKNEKDFSSEAKYVFINGTFIEDLSNNIKKKIVIIW